MEIIANIFAFPFNGFICSFLACKESKLTLIFKLEGFLLIAPGILSVNQAKWIGRRWRWSLYWKRRIFTDEYSEYFKDDENNADRFTDDYHENFTD